MDHCPTELPILPSPLKLCNGRYGLFVYNTNDAYIGKSLELYGEFCEFEMDFLKHFVKPGHTVLDIGANIGTHTLFFARHVGANGVVHAFEPQHIIFQQLCTNITLNGFLNVRCHNQGLSEHSGEMYIPSVDYSRKANFGNISLANEKAGEKIIVSTVDALNLAACHLIKADVEGMEELVIKGAQQTIARYRPILYVENDRPQKSPDLIRLIDSMNYLMFWQVGCYFNPNNFRKTTENAFGMQGCCNMVCVPIERASEVQGTPITSPLDKPSNMKFD